MAADGGDWQDVLVELGWWTVATDEAKTDVDDPEATGEAASTSGASSPDSASTTPVPIS